MVEQKDLPYRFVVDEYSPQGNWISVYPENPENYYSPDVSDTVVFILDELTEDQDNNDNGDFPILEVEQTPNTDNFRLLLSGPSPTTEGGLLYIKPRIQRERK